MKTQFSFEELSDSDLIVDATYIGGKLKNLKDDVLSPLMGVGNQGGFRFIGSSKNQKYKIAVLKSSMVDVDWPDELDQESGIFTYFGDNKSPGQELNGPLGNQLLEYCFMKLHGTLNERYEIPPFFVFTSTGEGRNVLFRGLAAPGAPSYLQSEDLVAIWKSKNGKRFQNYKSTFTILNAASISRQWIADIHRGDVLGASCPSVWRRWVEKGVYETLVSQKVSKVRKKEEQLPETKVEKRIIQVIHGYFEKTSFFNFEKFSAELLRLLDKNIKSIDVTRPTRDGGRDGIGLYHIGLQSSKVEVKFAVEAKCYDQSNSVGVKEVSRLISRLRHRDFGVLVTTSYVAQQAYEEIVEDGHPILILSGKDIAKILIDKGFSDTEKLLVWLEEISK